MAKGWISIHRSITDHWLWNDNEPFDKRSAWIDLLLMANHKDFKTVRKMELVNRKRGEVNTSITYLAQRWGWSRNKVYRFLELLKRDGMVTTDGTTDGTTVTIENYEKYQLVQSTDGTTDRTTDGTTDETTDGTYDNNGEQCINNDNKKRGRFIPPTLTEVQAYISEKGYHVDPEAFISFYESKGWMVGKNKMRSWQGAVGTWESRYKKEHQQRQIQQGSVNAVFQKIFEEHKYDV